MSDFLQEVSFFKTPTKSFMKRGSAMLTAMQGGTTGTTDIMKEETSATGEISGTTDSAASAILTMKAVTIKAGETSMKTTTVAVNPHVAGTEIGKETTLATKGISAGKEISMEKTT